jgi:DNA invertase Pin-like site-specific DNA recombinase/FtsZ-binding cell division protein ZapB
MAKKSSKQAAAAAQPYAISYMRFSTPEQAKGDSIRRQKKKALDWSTRERIPINTTFTDAGTSAFTDIAENLKAILKLIETGKIPAGTYLLVESLDRLSRKKVLEAMPVMLQLIDAGIIIVSLVDNQTYSKETLGENDGLIYSLIGTILRANQESEVKSMRLSEAWANKRAQAISGGTVMTRRAPAWLRVTGSGKNQRFEGIPERVEIVRRIFDLTIRGLGRRTIIRQFNDEGVASFGSGEKWQPSAIAKILTNKAVLGHFQPMRKVRGGGKEPYGAALPSYFPRIVSAGQFYRAKVAMQSRVAAGGQRSERVINLLNGLGYCAACQGRMMIENKGPKPKGGRYFSCSSYARRAGCTNSTRWPVEKIEELVLAKGRLIDWSRLKPEPAPDHDIDALIAAQAALVARRRNVMVMAEFNADLIPKANSLSIEINGLQMRIDELKSDDQAVKNQIDPGENLEILSSLLEKMENASGDDLVNLRIAISQTLRNGITKLYFYRDTVEVLFKGMVHASHPPQRLPPVALIRRPLTEAEQLDLEELGS